MSGHSKWATIKHKKSAQDAKRGRLFSKLAKELMVVARQGGGNPETNAALRALIQRCKAASMPSDNIERAIKKGMGELGGAALEEVLYEGYAPGGVGLIVSVLTDNKNRSAAEIRHIFNKYGSDFAGQGAVSRNFRRRGQIFVPVAGTDENKLMETALNAGAEDMQQDGDQFEILTEPRDLPTVQEAIEKAGFTITDAAVRMIPEATIPVTDKSIAKTVLNFIEALEEHDDVQDVFHNMDVADELLAELSQG